MSEEKAMYADADTINNTGMHPVEARVLLAIEKVEEKTKGGIILPEDAREREQMKQSIGTVLAYGDMAFTTNGNDWVDACRVGQRVIIPRYAGIEAKGKDGTPCRIVDDTDIIAWLDDDY